MRSLRYRNGSVSMVIRLHVQQNRRRGFPMMFWLIPSGQIHDGDAGRAYRESELLLKT